MPRNKNNKKKTKNISKIEHKIETVIKSFNIPYKSQASIGKYTVDFLVDSKYIIECYGDFWHCNPTKYTETFFNRGVKKTAKDIWGRDLRRKEELTSLGYHFLCLWESEINSSIKFITLKIKKFIHKGKI